MRHTQGSPSWRTVGNSSSGRMPRKKPHLDTSRNTPHSIRGTYMQLGARGNLRKLCPTCLVQAWQSLRRADAPSETNARRGTHH